MKKLEKFLDEIAKYDPINDLVLIDKRTGKKHTKLTKIFHEALKQQPKEAQKLRQTINSAIQTALS